jgi:hypothetical protein
VDHFALFQAAAHHPPTQALFTESLYGVQLLASPPFPDALSAPCPLCCMSFSVPYLLSSFCFFVFLGGVGVSLSRGLCWFIPGIAVGILHSPYLLICWSVSPKQVWSQHLEARETSCFLSCNSHCLLPPSSHHLGSPLRV